MDGDTSFVLSLGGIVVVLVVCAAIIGYIFSAQTLQCYKDNSTRTVAELKLLCG